MVLYMAPLASHKMPEAAQYLRSFAWHLGGLSACQLTLCGEALLSWPLASPHDSVAVYLHALRGFKFAENSLLWSAFPPPQTIRHSWAYLQSNQECYREIQVWLSAGSGQGQHPVAMPARAESAASRVKCSNFTSTIWQSAALPGRSSCDTSNCSSPTASW